MSWLSDLFLPKIDTSGIAQGDEIELDLSGNSNSNSSNNLAAYANLGSSAISLITGIITSKNQADLKNYEKQIAEINATAAEREALSKALREKTALLAAQNVQQQRTSRTGIVVVGIVVVAGLVVLAYVLLKPKPKPKQK